MKTVFHLLLFIIPGGILGGPPFPIIPARALRFIPAGSPGIPPPPPAPPIIYCIISCIPSILPISLTMFMMLPIPPIY